MTMCSGKTWSLLLLALCLTGCATGIYHDRQSIQNPNYYSGRTSSIIFPQFRLGGAREPQEERDASAPGRSQEMIALGVVASAWTLAHNPDYYKKSTIGGRCLLEAPRGTTLEIPCQNVTIALSDVKGRIINRYNSTNGAFEFYVEKNKDYGLSILSDKYEMTPPQVSPVNMGDDVILRLAPKRTKLSHNTK